MFSNLSYCDNQYIKGNNMGTTSTLNLYHLMLISLLLFSNDGDAQERQLEDLNAVLSTDIKNNDTTPRNVGVLPLHLSKEWQILSVENLILSKMNNDQTQIEAIFTVDKMKHLQHNIALKFQTGSYSLKNNYVLSGHYSIKNANQFFLTNIAQHDLYQFGRFRTETGYSDTDNVDEHHFKAFLHSAYSLINHGRFDLSVTASIESIHSTPSITSLEPLSQSSYYLNNSEQSTSTTLGVIGSFDLSDRWSLIGALTTSHLTNENNTNTLIDDQKKSVLIGTTYSF